MKITHIDHAIVPKPHPPSYLVHKYWARKPHNVVAQYIERYSRPGEIVFDPFIGSGVTALEALKLGRKVLGVDIDPTAIFITENTCKPVPLDRLASAFQKVRRAVEPEIRELYEWTCDACGGKTQVFQTIWQLQESRYLPTLVKYRCVCSGDALLRHSLTPAESAAVARTRYTPGYWYPDQRLITNTRINIHDGMTVADLFTPRNLAALSALRDGIGRLREKDVRKSLLFAFTSALAQVSKLHSIDMRPGREWGSRGWTARGYWIAPGFIEENVWAAFASRYGKLRAGVTDVARHGFVFRQGTTFENFQDGANFVVLNQSATDLSSIPDASVDLVFTDPPYGDNVPYLELHQIWWSWLRFQPDLEREIVISDSPERMKDFAEYDRLTNVAFSEVFRKLKPNRYMILTFNNTRIDVWNSIIRAATLAGFDLQKIIYQPPAVKPSKASLHPYGSSFGDYYLRLLKPEQGKFVYGEAAHLRQKYESVVVSTAVSVIAHRGEPVAFQYILNAVIPELDRNGVLLHASMDVKDVMENHLGREFVLHNVIDDENKVVGKKWWLAHPEDLKINFVPLNERVEKAVVNYLRRKDRATFDEIEQEVFTSFPNSLTPEGYTIGEVLAEYGRKLAGGYWALKASVALNEDRHQDYVNRLALLGNAFGFDVWTPDIGAAIRKTVMRKLDLPVPKNQLARIREIDVLWLKEGKIKFSFEVENTTLITEAIVRASNIPYSNRRFIVLPDERNAFLLRRLQEPLLAEQFKKDSWHVLFYSALDRLYSRLEEKRRVALSDLEAAISDAHAEPKHQLGFEFGSG